MASGPGILQSLHLRDCGTAGAVYLRRGKWAGYSTIAPPAGLRDRGSSISAPWQVGRVFCNRSTCGTAGPREQYICAAASGPGILQSLYCFCIEEGWLQRRQHISLDLTTDWIQTSFQYVVQAQYIFFYSNCLFSWCHCSETKYYLEAKTLYDR